jgi:serine/threonine protein kinase/Tol biopolymer transport system component
MGDEVSGSGLSAGFSVGSRIAGYRLEEQIGQGGMAVVFRALDERLDRQVALKVLAPGLAADEAFRQRFIRESRSAAAVDDPHIIPVFEAGEADGVLFIAMRYVPGGDVGTLVRDQGPLPSARAAAIISAVASALDAAHAAGLVHRDVKPANMLVDTRSGRPDHVYLSDFGLTKGSLSSASLTGTGHFMGTLDYCAPEQIQGRRVDARTDEYALACAAFALLAGEPPFPRDEGTAVLYAQLSAPPPLLTDRRPDLPPAVDNVLQRALAKAPDDRYASCGKFADALRMALGLKEYNLDRGAGPGSDRPLTEVVRTGDRDEHFFGLTADVVPQQVPAGTPDTTAGSAGMSGQERPAAGKRRRRSGIVTLGAAVILAAGGVAAAVILASAMGHRSSGTANLGAASRSPSSASARSGNPSSSGPSRPVTGRASNPGPVTDTIVRTFPDPGTGVRHVNSVALSPDNRTLATGDSNGNAYLWSTDTGRQIAVLHGSDTKVFAVAFSSDGTMVATGFGNGSASLWNAATGQLIDTIADPGGKAVNSLTFSPDGKTLATGDENGSAYFWDFTGGGHAVTLARTAADPTGAGIWAVAFSPDGKMLATGDYHGSTYLWDVAATGSPTATFIVPGQQDVTAVAFSRDGKTLATGNSDGTAYLWSLATRTHMVLSEPGTVWAVAFNQGGMLAVGDMDGSTYLYDAATGDKKATLTDPASGSQGVGAVAFSPDGKMLAAGDTNGTTYLWKIG